MKDTCVIVPGVLVRGVCMDEYEPPSSIPFLISGGSVLNQIAPAPPPPEEEESADDDDDDDGLRSADAASSTTVASGAGGGSGVSVYSGGRGGIVEGAGEGGVLYPPGDTGGGGKGGVGGPQTPGVDWYTGASLAWIRTWDDWSVDIGKWVPPGAVPQRYPTRPTSCNLSDFIGVWS